MTSPSLAAGMPSRASSSATARSHATTTWHPAPSAAPCTLAMTGTGQDRVAAMASSNESAYPCPGGCMIVRSAKSAPAQRCSPSPARTIARAAPPAPSSANAEVISRSIAIEIALRCSGRLNVTVATCPSRSTSIDELLNDGDDVALLDDAALLHADLLDRARRRRLDGDLHLHGLEDHERFA